MGRGTVQQVKRCGQNRGNQKKRPPSKSLGKEKKKKRGGKKKKKGGGDPLGDNQSTGGTAEQSSKNQQSRLNPPKKTKSESLKVRRTPNHQLKVTQVVGELLLSGSGGGTVNRKNSLRPSLPHQSQGGEGRGNGGGRLGPRRSSQKR